MKVNKVSNMGANIEISEPKNIPTKYNKFKIANQIVRSSHNLTSVQFKLFLTIIAFIQKKDNYLNDDLTIEIPIKELKKRGVTKNNNIYEIIKNEASGMNNISLLIEPKGSNDLKQVWFFEAMSTNKGILRVTLTQTGLPYLINLKEYYSLHSLSTLMKLRSNYAIRIYLLLYQYKDTGWVNITVEKLRNKLKVENRYTNFTNFRKHILQKAQDEIHDKTNIRFSWNEFKKGRRIHRLYFEIFEEDKAPKELKASDKKSNQKDLFPDQKRWRERLKNLYNLNDKKIDEIFELINSDNYKEFTQIFHQMELKRTNKEVRYLPGFAISMLINNLKDE